VNFSLADQLPNELGVCPACHTVVPFLFEAPHAAWHKGRDEPAGSLMVLRDVLP
jgi:hypothetical protein